MSLTNVSEIFQFFQGSVGGTTPDKAATPKAQRKDADKENIDVSEAQEVEENASGKVLHESRFK